MNTKKLHELVARVCIAKGFSESIKMNEGYIELGGRHGVSIFCEGKDFMDDTYAHYYINHSPCWKNAEEAFQLANLLDMAGQIGNALEREGLTYKS